MGFKLSLILTLCTPCVIAGGATAWIYATVSSDTRRLAEARADLAAQDYATATQELEALAETGESSAREHARSAARWLDWDNGVDAPAEALHELVIMDREGLGRKKDRQQELAHLRKAAMRGHPESEKELARLYLRGDGVERDLSEARRWMEAAANGGDADAMNELGVLLQDEELGEPDFEEVATWFTLAAERGSVHGQRNLARSYIKGQGVPQDGTRAIELLLPIAESGDAVASWNIGVILHHGMFGVDRDFSEAARWYERSIEAGSTLAQANLGWLYETGNGVERDYERAAEHYQRGANNGDGLAAYNLGLAFAKGLGVPRDLYAAEKYLREAALRNIENADEELNIIVAEIRRNEAGASAANQVQDLHERIRFIEDNMAADLKINSMLCNENFADRRTGSNFLRFTAGERELCALTAQSLKKARQEIAEVKSELARVRRAAGLSGTRDTRPSYVCKCSDGSSVTLKSLTGECSPFCRSLGSVPASIGPSH